RSWAEADPKRAGGGAPSHGRASAAQEEGCKEPARRMALHGGTRRRAAGGAGGARRGGPVGAAERGGTEHVRRPLTKLQAQLPSRATRRHRLYVRGALRGPPPLEGVGRDVVARPQGKTFPY